MAEEVEPEEGGEEKGWTRFRNDSAEQARGVKEKALERVAKIVRYFERWR